MVRTRKFGGETYTHYSGRYHRRKSDAEGIAKNLRKRNWKARVVKTEKGYAIFQRR